MYNTDRKGIRYLEWMLDKYDVPFIQTEADEVANYAARDVRVILNGLDGDSKGFARGHREAANRGPTMLHNMGTENGLKRFDFRTMLRNLYNTDNWYKYNPKAHGEEVRKGYSRQRVEERTRIRRWSKRG